MHGTCSDLSISGVSSELCGPPVVLEHAPEGGSRFILIAVLLPLLVALLAPFWLVTAQLASDPGARDILSARPLIGVQLVVGLLVLVGIFGWPLLALARRALGWRRITIGAGTVLSEGVGLFGTRSWSEPLADYLGLAHRVRTSLSGVRHELVLVHTRPSRTVILVSGAQLTPEEIATMARLFAVAEIPSRETASVMPLHGYFGAVEGKPLLAAG